MPELKNRLKTIALFILIGLIVIVVVGFLVFLIYKEITTPKPWTGIYYSNVEDTSGVKSPALETLDKCREWAHKEAEQQDRKSVV